MEYDRLVAEWLAAGRPTSTSTATDITIAELLGRFKAFAERHYVRWPVTLLGMRGSSPHGWRLLRKHHPRSNCWPAISDTGEGDS